MSVETRQIIVRKGTGVPINLAEGEFGFDTQADILYLGVGGGNVIVFSKTDHLHTKSNISDFEHNHTKAEIIDFAHNHDTDYYTKPQISSLLLNKSDTTHTHVMADITDLSSGGNANAMLTLFKGTQTIDATTPERYITLPLNELKNCTIILTWSSVDFGYSNVETTVFVGSNGNANVYYHDGQAGYVDFNMHFQEDSLYFYFYSQEVGIYQDYTIKKIQLYLNK